LGDDVNLWQCLTCENTQDVKPDVEMRVGHLRIVKRFFIDTNYNRMYFIIDENVLYRMTADGYTAPADRTLEGLLKDKNVIEISTK